MRIAIPGRWLLLFLVALGLALLAQGGIYQLTVVTVPGTGSDSAYVVAYRLNRLTGSVVVCDTDGCEPLLGGWFAPASKAKRDEATPEKAM